MQTVFTEDDIVRFIYQETSDEECQAIEFAIQTDNSLRKVYVQLMEVVQRMDAVVAKPNPSTIDLILEHSRASASHLEASL